MRNTSREAIWRTARGSIGLLLLGAFLFAIPRSTIALDVDDDGTEDHTVYRPSSGNWFVAPSGMDVTLLYQWGLSGDYPVASGYTGGNGEDIAVWRPSTGTWYIRQHNDSLTFPTATAWQWGLSGDSPQHCDFNGDDRDELAVYRPSNGTWYLRNSTTDPDTTYQTANSQQWGLSGDVPVPEDYDGDGECDFAIYRDGQWYIVLSSTGEMNSSDRQTVIIAWGTEGDTPIVQDHDDDGILDFIVWRPANGTWYVRQSSLLSNLTQFVDSFQWGLQGDQAMQDFDVDGDDRPDLCVWRNSDGVWYCRTSSSSFASAVALQFGLPGDIPFADIRGSDPS